MATKSERWTTKQTRQGTWVMADNGHQAGPHSEAVAMVYMPEASQVDGTTLEERVTNAEAMALARAKRMAAANDMIDALLAIRSRVAEAGKSLPRGRDADQMAALEDSFVTIPTAMLRDAFAALRKAGVLP